MLFKSDVAGGPAARLTLTECLSKCHDVTPTINSRQNRIDIPTKTKGKGGWFRAATKFPSLEGGAYRLSLKIEQAKTLEGLYLSVERADRHEVLACIDQVGRDTQLTFSLTSTADDICLCIGSPKYAGSDVIALTNIVLTHERRTVARQELFSFEHIPSTAVVQPSPIALEVAHAGAGALSRSDATVLSLPQGLASLGVLGRGSVESVHTRLVFTSKRTGERLGVLHMSLQHREHVLRLHVPEGDVSLHLESREHARIDIDRISLTPGVGGSTLAADIGVVIPMRNCAHYIERCVDSLANQTVKPACVYIVDDASDDGSAEAAAALVRTYEGQLDIVLIRNAVCMGPYVSKNRALELYGSRHTIWALQDADDYSLCNRLEAQLRQLMKRPDVGIVYCNCIRVADGSAVLNRGMRSRRCYAAAMFRYVFLNEVGYYESVKYGADDEFNTRVKTLLGPQAIYDVADPLYMAELRENSLTNTPSSRADVESGQLSELRSRYAASFSEPRKKLPPLSAHPATPKELCAVPCLNLNMATYPSRFSSALEVISEVTQALIGLEFRFSLCINGVSGVPEEFKSLAEDPRFSILIPQVDLKDNGKFVNVRPGFSFWLDDDISYTRDYFRQGLQLMLRSEPNTPFCVHGFSGTSVSGTDRDLIHFEAALPSARICTVGGTGTLFMWVQDSEFVDAIRDIPQYELTGAVDLLFALACATHNRQIQSIARDFSTITPKTLAADGASLFEVNKGRAVELDSLLGVINAVLRSRVSLRKRAVRLTHL